MTYATTFSGIGGWEIGLNACGWKLKWQCECDPFCRAVLTERFGVPIYEDIRTICEHNPALVDALIGSPPYQPFSITGEKLGLGDGRHLYPSFKKLVSHFRPRWVLMEQVPNILVLDNGRPFGQYISGLVSLGYSIIWHGIPASSIGHCHERDRLWFIAHSNSDGHKEGFASRTQEGLATHDKFLERTVWNSLGDEMSFEACFYGGIDGLPDWAHRIHALGNAVVPQIPFLIGQAINQIEREDILNFHAVKGE